MARKKSKAKRDEPVVDAPRRLSRGTGPIFADIDSALRRRFHEISREEKFPEKIAIEVLVRYFVDSLDRNERRSMLAGEKSVVQSLAKAIELLQWGQHSFTNRRWEWCFKTSLARIEECKGIDEITRFANYRLGYCTLSMAEGIRRELFEAIDRGDASGRRLAHRAFEYASRAGIYYSRQSIKQGETSVAHYNVACGFSLLAENTALEATDWPPGEPWVDMLRLQISAWLKLLKPTGDVDMRDAQSVNHPALRNFAAGWRAHLERSGRDASTLTSLVDSSLSEAISELKNTVQMPSHAAVPSDAGELVRSSSTELDFSFLRNDSKYSVFFEKWEQLNKPSSSRLTSFLTLWSHLKDAPAIEAYDLFEPAVIRGAAGQPPNRITVEHGPSY